MPSIIWNHAAIGLGGSVDDRKYDRALVITTEADIFHDANVHTSQPFSPWIAARGPS
jgi:hypothetical protein